MFSPKKVKAQSLLGAGVIFFIVSVIGIYFVWSMQNDLFLGKLSKTDAKIHKTIEKNIKSARVEFSKKLRKFVYQKKITNSIKTRDRDKLYKYSKIFFTNVQKEIPSVRIMTFRLKDGKTFLRVHKPKFHSDMVSRNRTSIWDTNYYRTPNYGFEQGKLALSYRIVLPVYDDENFYGTVEMGIDPSFFLKSITNSLGINTTTLVKNNLLQDSQKNVKQEVSYNGFSPLVENDVVKGLLDGLLLNKNSIKEYAGKSYYVHTDIELRNHRDEHVAYLFAYQDISDEIVEKDTILLEIIFMFIIAFSVLLILLNISFNYFLRDIKVKLYIDQLTNLYNHISLQDNIHKKSEKQLILIDINEFSDINDMYGSDSGNKVLKKVADIVSKTANANNMTSYRIASDVFVLMMESKFINTEKIEKLLIELREKITSLDFVIESYNDTFHINVTQSVAHGQDDVLEHAYMALRYAKKNHLDYIAFSDAVDSSVQTARTFVLKKNIFHALYNDGIIPHFQPITNSYKKIVKYEALVRMKCMESDRLISPLEFLPVAIKYGSYPKITKIMIETSLSFFENRDEQVSINLLPSDIQNKDIIQLITQKIKAYPKPERIIFEIVEQDGIEDYSYMNKFIDKIHSMGAKIAIDDFGTGYSNFKHILELNPDYIKIDGSLVKNILNDEKSKILVKSIVDFSHALNIKVIAEYVEDEKIFKLLKTLNVDEFQGYYFGKPKEMINAG